MLQTFNIGKQTTTLIFYCGILLYNKSINDLEETVFPNESPLFLQNTRNEKEVKNNVSKTPLSKNLMQ